MGEAVGNDVPTETSASRRGIGSSSTPTIATMGSFCRANARTHGLERDDHDYGGTVDSGLGFANALFVFTRKTERGRLGNGTGH